MTRQTVKAAVNALAQNTSQGRPSIVQDYEATFKEAIDLAERLFTLDRRNTRVVDITLSSAGWRFVLNGGGALAGLTGLNAFTTGESSLTSVVLPYAVDTRRVTPLERELWRIATEPNGASVLEVADDAAAGEVLRLTFENKHVVHDTDASQTTVPARDEQAFETLAAALLLQIAANKAAQNTGSSQLPNDTVNRQSQGDILKARSRDMMALYDRLMGKTPVVGSSSGGASPAPASPPPLSGFKDLDATFSHPLGGLFHGGRRT